MYIHSCAESASSTDSSPPIPNPNPNRQNPDGGPLERRRSEREWDWDWIGIGLGIEVLQVRAGAFKCRFGKVRSNSKSPAYWHAGAVAFGFRIFNLFACN